VHGRIHPGQKESFILSEAITKRQAKDLGLPTETHASLSACQDRDQRISLKMKDIEAADFNPFKNHNQR
jgi:hypothetical protein